MAEETFDLTDEQAQALGAKLTHAFDAHPVIGVPAYPDPDETWEFDGGRGWVYRVPDNPTVTKPVIIADGFGAGASALNEWAGLWAMGSSGAHPWGKQLHESGRDVIILGYDSRNVPIRTNAAVARQCVLKAIAEKPDNGESLVVGGLSMGGLVTRYALAAMEHDDIDHCTATYFSYDSPHQGAWIPISLQVFAHFLAALADALPIAPDKKEQMKGMSALINSPAARELLWKHTSKHAEPGTPPEPVGPAFEPDQARADFLAALEAVGNWPQRPRKVAVANGRGDGQGLDIAAGPNLVWAPKLLQPSATLYAQAVEKDKDALTLVATLTRALGLGDITIQPRTSRRWTARPAERSTASPSPPRR